MMAPVTRGRKRKQGGDDHDMDYKPPRTRKKPGHPKKPAAPKKATTPRNAHPPAPKRHRPYPRSVDLDTSIDELVVITSNNAQSNQPAKTSGAPIETGLPTPRPTPSRLAEATKEPRTSVPAEHKTSIITDASEENSTENWKPSGVLGDELDIGLSKIEQADRTVRVWDEILKYHKKNHPKGLSAILRGRRRAVEARKRLKRTKENMTPVCDLNSTRENAVKFRVATLERAMKRSQSDDEKHNILAAIRGYKSEEIRYSTNYTLIWAGQIVDTCPSYESFAYDRQGRLDRYYELHGSGCLWWERPLAVAPLTAKMATSITLRNTDFLRYCTGGHGYYYINMRFQPLSNVATHDHERRKRLKSIAVQRKEPLRDDDGSDYEEHDSDFDSAGRRRRKVRKGEITEKDENADGVENEHSSATVGPSSGNGVFAKRKGKQKATNRGDGNGLPESSSPRSQSKPAKNARLRRIQRSSTSAKDAPESDEVSDQSNRGLGRGALRANGPGEAGPSKTGPGKSTQDRPGSDADAGPDADGDVETDSDLDMDDYIYSPAIPYRCLLDSGAQYPMLLPADIQDLGIGEASNSIDVFHSANGRMEARIWDMLVCIVDRDNNDLVSDDQPTWPGEPGYLGGIVPVGLPIPPEGEMRAEIVDTGDSDNDDGDGDNGTKRSKVRYNFFDPKRSENDCIDRLSGILPFNACYMSSAAGEFRINVGKDKRDVVGVHRLPAGRRYDTYRNLDVRFPEIVRKRFGKIKGTQIARFEHKVVTDEGQVEAIIDEDVDGQRGVSRITHVEADGARYAYYIEPRRLPRQATLPPPEPPAPRLRLDSGDDG